MSATLTPIADRLMACRRACEFLSDVAVQMLDTGGVKELVLSLQELFDAYTDGRTPEECCTCIRENAQGDVWEDHPANPCEVCRAAAILNRIPAEERYPRVIAPDESDSDLFSESEDKSNAAA